MTSRTVIVTGGSQNIGLAICHAFAASGDNVICADLHPPAEKQSFVFMHTDVASEESVIALISSVESRFGVLDVLVNNAGICKEVRLQDMSAPDFDQTMAVNVRSVFLTCKHAAPLMQCSSKAAIINISSIEGLGANPLHAAYAASKGAVASLTRNIALVLLDCRVTPLT